MYRFISTRSWRLLASNHCSEFSKTKQLSDFRLARYFSNHLTSGWPDGVKQFLQREKIEQPTPIQEKTLPFAVNDKDVVGIARTGSGKTLAFVIPAVMKILKAREAQNQTDDAFTGRRSTPRCLILAPTRELASQIYEVLRKFTDLGISSVSLVGGSSRSDQIRQLNRGNQDIYVATPGRLMDLIDSSVVDLSSIEYLVLDEADRMLDMGFEPQIRRIADSLPDKRQTLMWSATWPREIQELANDFLHDFEFVAVDSEKLKANPNIKQIVDVCEPYEKSKLLLQYLKDFSDESGKPARTLIFVNTKRLADHLLVQLMRQRIKAIALHGDRTQRQREDALRMFKGRMCNVLVATDVAARGLDISDITHVINYDFPNTIEDYIHRIGRTARHEKKGVSITLFTTNNLNNIDKLIKVLRETNQEIPEKLQDLANNKHKYRMDTNEFQRRDRRDRRNDFYGGRQRGRQYATGGIFDE